MINNRQQSGRRRGRGGQRQGGGGGAPGRPDGGNRIDNRARGNANQLWEKYKNLAADAARAGDRVQTEYYLQFADHYYRVLAETRPNFQEQQRQQRARDEQFDADGFSENDDGSEDYGDEGEPARAGDQAQFGGGDQPRRYEERRPRRDEEGRGESNGDGRGDDRRPQRAEEDRRPRRDAEEDRRPRRDRDGRERFNGQPRGDAPNPIAAAPEPVEPDLPLSEPEAEQPQPRRRGRPRKEAAEEPLGFDPARLPPALGAPANDADEPGEAKPRRRRAPRAAETELPAAE